MRDTREVGRQRWVTRAPSDDSGGHRLCGLTIASYVIVRKPCLGDNDGRMASHAALPSPPQLCLCPFVSQKQADAAARPAHACELAGITGARDPAARSNGPGGLPNRRHDLGEWLSVLPTAGQRDGIRAWRKRQLLVSDLSALGGCEESASWRVGSLRSGVVSWRHKLSRHNDNSTGFTFRSFLCHY